MSDILDFLNARIAEDEAEARRALEQLGMVAEAKADLRAFAECAAKRKIIDLADEVDPVAVRTTAILKALAAIYADHPDYQQAWANCGR